MDQQPGNPQIDPSRQAEHMQLLLDNLETLFRYERAIIYRAVRNPDEADEIADNVLYSAVAGMQSFMGANAPENPAAELNAMARWIGGIAHNKCLMANRAAARHRNLSLEALSEDDDQPEITDDSVEQAFARVLDIDHLQSVIARARETTTITDKQLVAVTLRYIGELKTTEVASRLGVDQRAARALIYRGLANLRIAARDQSQPPTEKQ